MTPEERIRWIYQAQDPDELARRYDAWAEDYDQHLEVDLNYIAPIIGVQRLAQCVPTEATVLDAGAGTGLVGQRLYEAGYRDIVGIDYAPAMLEKARQKGVYTELSVQDLGKPLSFASDRFDAVISIGVFSFGHAPVHAFDELIRVTRTGGIILFSVLTRFYEAGDFRLYLEQLERAGKWVMVEAGEPFRSRNEIDADASGLAFTYRVC